MAKNASKAVEAENPTVMCVVLEKFKDKTIGETRRKGDVIMVTEARFSELTAKKQWVKKIEQPNQEVDKAEPDPAE